MTLSNGRVAILKNVRKLQAWGGKGSELVGELEKHFEFLITCVSVKGPFIKIYLMMGYFCKIALSDAMTQIITISVC